MIACTLGRKAKRIQDPGMARRATLSLGQQPGRFLALALPTGFCRTLKKARHVGRESGRGAHAHPCQQLAPAGHMLRPALFSWIEIA